ncbi:MAG: alkaline phosphatase D family protein [Asticcacaulis sp.]
MTRSPADLNRRNLFARLGGATLATTLLSDSANAQNGAPVRFTHGVASGDPTRRSLIIWTRALPLEGSGVSEVVYEVASDPAFEHIVQSGRVLTHKNRDHTIKVDVQGLKAGTLYHYRFQAGNVISPAGQGRTLPETADQVKLAVISCSNYPFGYFNVYRALSEQNDLDAIVHLGDYIYEYGPEGYGRDIGRKLGRNHEPAHEILTLDDYRQRFAQYRSDPDLQAAHAKAAFITVWDDHETANNTWLGGAQNHDSDTEGDWYARRDAAIQAYFEWLPMRDPVQGKAAYSLNRVYDFADIASVIAIETRLTGRSLQISASKDMLFKADGTPDFARFEAEKLGDPTRSMLGPIQEVWLDKALKASVSRGIGWQILANQVVVAPMRGPDFFKHMPDDMRAKLPDYGIKWFESAKRGLPINLDSWDGYAAARLRLYDSLKASGGKTVILSGDTHMFWGNHLHDPRDGQAVAVEFGVTSVTSQGGYETLTDDERIFDIVPEALTSHNRDVEYSNVRDRGFIIVTATRTEVTADYYRVTTILSRDFETEALVRIESQGNADFRLTKA